jgi:hypothetical protein
MAKESFGIVAAAQRARAWAPHLDSYGQRLILAGLVVYMGADSMSDPTIGQLAAWSGFKPASVSRILTALCDEMRVIAPVDGRSRGRRATRWMIQPPPPGDGSTLTVGQGSVIPNPHPGEVNPHPGSSQPSPQGDPTEVSEISEGEECASHSFGPVVPGLRVRPKCVVCGFSEDTELAVVAHG